MATTVAVGEAEIDTLLTLMGELVEAGRHDEATKLAKVYTAVCIMLNPELLEGEEDDEEFLRDVEEAERDFAAGIWVSDEDVMRRLAALSDG